MSDTPGSQPAAAAAVDPVAPDALIDGNLLPQRWRGRDRFVVLASGFGQGHRFLATWEAWRADPQRCARLVYVTVAPRAPSRTELEAALRGSPLRDLVDALLDAWPPVVPNLHRLPLDGGRVTLMLLLFTGFDQALRELVADVDAFVLDALQAQDLPAPATTAASRAWGQHLGKALGRLAAPGATLAASLVLPALRDGLMSAGFVTPVATHSDGAHAIMLATFAPRFTPRRSNVRDPAPAIRERRALIVGAGLAGCAAAWALAEHGWRTCVLERRSAIAAEGSGNPAGLFHGIVNAQDGLHARFNRAAALEASRAVQIALASHGVGGNAQGLLRIELVLDLSTMRATLARLHLPAEYVEAVDSATAGKLAGIALASPAWFYPGGGWVHPGGLARSCLERAGACVALRTDVDVVALERRAGGWRLLDRHGAVIDEADVVVLANAGDAMRLLGDAAPSMQAVRGQISIVPAARRRSAADFHLPSLPIAGSGYLLPDVDGQAIFGATSQPGDPDASVRHADHIVNLAQLERLTGARLDSSPDRLDGRTAWRWVTPDRLPVIGAVPARPCPAARQPDQPRRVPRTPGLFVFTGLGSRGITWSALGAQVLAASISGAPMPVEASLLDAIDPARFIARRARRAAGA